MYGFGGVGLSEVQLSISELSVVGGGWVGGGGWVEHHSNRSSWRARPEKHLRGPLTCPGDTGEPEAPVSGGAQTQQFGSRGKK